MSQGTKIEWATDTINPVVGCSRVSPACDNCYAARMASSRLMHTVRYRGLAKDGGWTGEIRVDLGELRKLYRWHRGRRRDGTRRRVFVCSMGDLFHRWTPDRARWAVLGAIEECPSVDCLILTKRPGIMRRVISERYGVNPPPENLWLGVTAESREEAERRIPLLLRTPAAVRFVSFEPLLKSPAGIGLDGIDWAIVGAETGPGARFMCQTWARQIRDECGRAGTAFFFKKMSGGVPVPDDLMIRELPR